METQKDTIKVSKVEKKEGVRSDGQKYIRWKVYDQNGMYYSGFNEPNVTEGETYEVVYELAGKENQFMNYKKFTRIEPGEGQETLSKKPKKTSRDEKIKRLHREKVAVELAKFTISQGYNKKDVVKEWKEIVELMKDGE